MLIKTTENFYLGVPLSVVGLLEVMYFVWLEGRFAGLNLPDNCVPDFLVVQGRVGRGRRLCSSNG